MAQTEAPDSSESEFDAIHNAELYDLTQAYVVDKSAFARRVASELPQRYDSPRIVELGCGTGGFALPVLREIGPFQYLGIDIAATMTDIFQSKLPYEDPRLKTSIELAPGIDLRRRDAYEPIGAFAPDVLICSQFTQYLPLEVPSGGGTLSRSEFLKLCRSLLRDDGTLFLIDDVDGETDEEAKQFGRTWDRYVIDQYRSAPELLKQIALIDEEFVRAIQMAMENPSLMAMIRARRRKNRGEHIVPASVERKLFSEAGFTVDEQRHEQLPNFYLYVLRPVDTATRQ